jgi:hypothetical protein
MDGDDADATGADGYERNAWNGTAYVVAYVVAVPVTEPGAAGASIPPSREAANAEEKLGFDRNPNTDSLSCFASDSSSLLSRENTCAMMQQLRWLVIYTSKGRNTGMHCWMTFADGRPFT